MGYALITGASKGIGKALAYELATKGYSLLLTARSAVLLDDIAADVQLKYPVKVITKAIDLSEPDAPEAIAHWVNQTGVALEVLVNNAGYGLWGRFKGLPLAGQFNMLQLNITAPVKLTHLLLPNLLAQKQSYVLNVASTTAYQAIPAMALYAASKAFVVSYSRALTTELKHTPVSVSCLSPGATDTGFMDRAEINDAGIRRQAAQVDMSPEAVAKIAVKGMLNKQVEIIPGVANKFTALAAKFLPKALIEAVAANIYLK